MEERRGGVMEEREEERRAWQGMKAAVNSGHYFKRMFHTLHRQGQLARHNVEAVIEHTHTHVQRNAHTHPSREDDFEQEQRVTVEGLSSQSSCSRGNQQSSKV